MDCGRDLRQWAVGATLGGDRESRGRSSGIAGNWRIAVLSAANLEERK
jgi:hypothetical protein